MVHRRDRRARRERGKNAGEPAFCTRHSCESRNPGISHVERATVWIPDRVRDDSLQRLSGNSSFSILRALCDRCFLRLNGSRPRFT